MVVYFKKENGGLKKLTAPEKGCWIHVYGPFSSEESQKLSEHLSIDIEFITDSLDIDERARYESDEGKDLIVLKTPVENEGISDSEALVITIPIGIVRTPDHIITISAHRNNVVESLMNNAPKGFNPEDQEQFILTLFERNVDAFSHYLRTLNNKRYSFEKALYNSSRNEDLTNLLNIQKSLIYFVTNLRTNDLLLMKIQRTNFLKIQDEERIDYLRDIIVDNGQALEMSEMYSNILNGTMDTFASIISNNLNQVMKRLTSVTIVLMIPTLIASFYGMNVELPLQHSAYAFVWVFGISILVAILFTMYFVRKNWF
ncbi:MAG: magnesium transporter CorA family protein [Chitinophagales bacterium]|nr:magnesium transporter CorA family protein [Chitinophagales bacterium]